MERKEIICNQCLSQDIDYKSDITMHKDKVILCECKNCGYEWFDKIEINITEQDFKKWIK